MAKSTAKSKPSFYQQVNAAFYADVKSQNGGKLPPDLVDSHGKPRGLTQSASDRAYRQNWQAVAASLRNSKAVSGKSVKEVCVPCAAKAAAAKVPPITLPSKVNGEPMAVASTATDKTKTKKKQTAVPCKHESLTVKCSHGSRKYTLTLPGKGPDGSEITSGTFEVITDGKENIECESKIVAGPCPAVHKGKVFDIYPDDSVKTRTDSKLSFKAHCDSGVDLAHPLSFLWPTQTRSETFTIRAQTCQREQPLSAVVIARPQIDWDVSFQAKIDVERDEDERDPKGAINNRKHQIDLGFDVSVTVNGVKYVLGAEFKDHLEKIARFVDHAVNACKFVSGVLDFVGGVKVTVLFPSVTLKGQWGWEEVANNPHCGFGWGVTLEADPLIGASWTGDVLDVLIKKVPAIGQMISRVRKRLEKTAKIALEFKVKGVIKGAISYKKNVIEEKGDASGQVGGEIKFTFEGKIETKKKHVWFVQFGAEIKAGAKASFEGLVKAGSDNEGLYYKGELKFNGLTFYASFHIQANVTWGSAPDEDKESNKEEVGGDWEAKLIGSHTLLGGEAHRLVENHHGD